MKKSGTVLLLLITVLLLLGCSKEFSEATYNRLLTELREMGYDVDAKSVQVDILQGQRRWLTIDETENISVYLYESPGKMEKDASYIDEGGSSYRNGESSVEISWVSLPHFYRKDNIIVLYVGEDAHIISALEEIMGDQFAGHKD